MNDLEQAKIQTPIEIALGIDENGMTTARKLYAFLELAQGQFSRWAKTNITENEFATENEDWVRFDIDVETPTGGIVKRDDYRLTAHFAKKLSMKGNGEKAEEAREYFTHLEERVKQKAVDFNQLSPELQILQGLLSQMVQKELADKERDKQIAIAKETADKAVATTESIKEAVKPVFDNWRNEVNAKFNRIQKSSGTQFKDLRTEMYYELEHRAGCDLNTRLRNKRSRMAENGCTKTEINALNKMDVIEDDKKLREIFSKIVTEYEIRYCA